MTVTLTGSNGLFTRLGKLFKVVERIQTLQTNGTTGLAAEIEDVLDEYNSADMQYADALSNSTEHWQKSCANIYSAVTRVAKETIIGMVDDDTTLNQKTLGKALDELLDQMGTSSDVKGNVFNVSGTVSGGTAFTGTGNGCIITSDTNGEGAKFQNLHEDVTTVKCIKDAQVTGTAGRETFVVMCEKSETDVRHPDFPGGNGQNNSISVSDPAYSQQSSQNRNSLNNSNFENFTTTNTPDKWSIVVGAAGTEILEESTIVHRGSKCLEFNDGAGSSLTKIEQSFDTSGQTTVKLRPETRYCVSFWTYRTSGVGSGVLKVSLKDGSNNILRSGAAALSVTLGSDTVTTWTHHSFTFSTTAVLTASAKFVIELTTALGPASQVYIDGVQCFRMAHLTNSSSFHIAVIPGATDFIVDDYAKLTITKTTTGKMQSFCNQFLGLENLGLQLPYQTDASESISDSLIA